MGRRKRKARVFNGKKYTLSGWPLRTKSEARARADRRRKEGYLARVTGTRGKQRVWMVWVRKKPVSYWRRKK